MAPLIGAASLLEYSDCVMPPNLTMSGAVASSSLHGSQLEDALTSPTVSTGRLVLHLGDVSSLAAAPPTNATFLRVEWPFVVHSMSLGRLSVGASISAEDDEERRIEVASTVSDIELVKPVLAVNGSIIVDPNSNVSAGSGVLTMFEILNTGNGAAYEVDLVFDSVDGPEGLIPVRVEFNGTNGTLAVLSPNESIAVRVTLEAGPLIPLTSNITLRVSLRY